MPVCETLSESVRKNSPGISDWGGFMSAPLLVRLGGPGEPQETSGLCACTARVLYLLLLLSSSRGDLARCVCMHDALYQGIGRPYVCTLNVHITRMLILS